MKKIWIALLAMLMVFALVSAVAEDEPILIKLSDEGSVCDAVCVTVKDSIITIYLPGEYRLEGTLSEGQIRVECQTAGKVTLYLDNVNVTNPYGAALYIGKVSPRLSICTVEGSVNIFTGGTDAPLDKSVEVDGVIYSRSDLTITGDGMLSVVSPYYNGIVSKDDLRVKGGRLLVDAGKNGLCGKDGVEIYDGVIDIKAGKDGIRSSNAKDESLGYIEITGGQITMTYGDDAFDYVTRFQAQDCVIYAQKK